MAKQIANYFNKELIRCVKVDENGETIVKYLSPYVVKYPFLLEQEGFKPDDPNLEEKLGIEKEEIIAIESRQEPQVEVVVESQIIEDKITEVKQTATASSLIERFGDPGTPKRKRKRQKIKIHHAD